MRRALMVLVVALAAGCADNPRRDDGAAKVLDAQRDGYAQGYNDALRQQQYEQSQRRRLPATAPSPAMPSLPALSPPALPGGL